MSVKVRERTLKDGKIRLCYDVYSQGQRELRRDEPALYILPTDSKSTQKAVRERAKQRALQLELDVRQGHYVFRNPLPTVNTKMEPGTITSRTHPTFLSLFEAEALRRTVELTRKQERNAKEGKQVHRKKQDDVHYCLLRFKEFLQTKGKTDIHYQDVTPMLLGQFKQFLLALVADTSVKFSSNTAAAYLKKFKTVALIAYNEGLLRKNVVNQIPNIRLEAFERRYLTEEEVNKLLDSLEQDPSDGLMKRAFLFCCTMSLRFGDLVTIRWKDVKDGRLVFRPGKSQNRKILDLKLHQTALQLMGERGKDSQCIFPVKYSSAQNDKLNLWILGQGINKGRITFHSGRHTAATILLKRTKSIAVTQRILGHSRPETTMIYAKVISAELDEALDSLDGVFGSQPDKVQL